MPSSFKVLVVGSERFDFHSIESILGSLSCQAVCAAGLHAKQLAAEGLQEFALILLDCSLNLGREFSSTGIPVWVLGVGVPGAHEGQQEVQSFNPKVAQAVGRLTALEQIEAAYEQGAADVLFAPLSARALAAKIQYFLKLQMQNRNELARAVEQELQKSEQRFRQLANSIPHFVWVLAQNSNLNENSTQDFCNQKWIEYTGTEMANEQVWIELVHPDEASRVWEKWQGARATGTVYEAEFRLLNSCNKQYRWFKARAVPVFNEQGEIDKWYGTCSDIHSEWQAIIELEEKSSRLEGVIGSMAEGLLFIAPGGNFVRMNEAAAKMFGASREQLTDGILRSPFVGFEAHSLDGALLAHDELPSQRVLRGERFPGVEVLVEQEHSERTWIASVGGAPIYDRNGNFTMGVLTVHDITEQKNAEIKLRESERKFKQLADSMPLLVWTTLADGQVDYRNQRLLDFLGANESEASAETWKEICHPDDFQKSVDAWKAAVQEGVPLEVEYRLFNRALRKYRWYLGRAVPFRNSEGEIIKWFGTSSDVHETKLSQHNLELIIGTIPQGIWRADPHGKADYVSNRLCENVGYSREEMLNWGWADAIHPEDQPRVLAEWQQSRTQQKPVSVDFRLRRKDGTYRWHLSQGNPFFDENGKLVKYYGTLTDVHDQKMALKNIERERQALELLFEKSPTFFAIMKGPEFLLEKCNSHFVNLVGAQDILGMPLFNGVLEIKEPELLAKLTGTLTTGVPYVGTEVLLLVKRSSAGLVEERCVNIVFQQMLDEDSNPAGVFAHGIDVTEKASAQKAMQEAQDEEERANLLKSAFLVNMSHEIRTPLGAMIGFAELLREPGLQESERLQYTDILIRNGGQLAVIIDDVLDLSKVEAGHLLLEFVETRIDSIVAEVIALLQVKAQEKNLVLEYLPNGMTPVTFFSDPLRVRQVLLKLVSNAIKFTEKGGITILNRGLIEVDGALRAAIEIVDTGIGIPPHHQTQVFELFVQADGSITRRFGGTGLGLSLSRKLARALGGDVVLLKSEVDRGSTFLVTVAAGMTRAQTRGATSENKVEKAKFLFSKTSSSDTPLS